MTPEEETLQQAESELPKKTQEAEAERASFRDRIDTLLDAAYREFRKSWAAGNTKGVEAPLALHQCAPVFIEAFRAGIMEALRAVGLDQEDVRELTTNPGAVVIVACTPVREDAEKRKLAADIQIAWWKYTELFGEAPHGTLKQLNALVELLPRG